MRGNATVLVVFFCACGGDAGNSVEREDPDLAMGASVLAGPGSSTHPAMSPDGVRLAFMSNAEGVRAGLPINFEIYVAESDGRDPIRLTENQEFDADIAWSPDGSQIVFKSFRDQNDEIYVMNADGSEAP